MGVRTGRLPPSAFRLRLVLGTAVLTRKGRYALRPCVLRAPLPAGRLRRAQREPDARTSVSCPDRKPVECRQRLQARLDVPEIDLGLEKRDFTLQLAFVDKSLTSPGLQPPEE
jgi:hypothetical protein